MSKRDRDDLYQDFITELDQNRFLAEEIINAEHRRRTSDYAADCKADREFLKRISGNWEAGNYEAIGKLIAGLWDEAFEQYCEEAEL